MNSTASQNDDVWTVRRILGWTTDFLKQKGIESARLEAELLLACARNCQRIRLYTDFESPLTDDERSRMRSFVQRRAKREPLAYITGHREFYGRDFAVGPGVLVPRPETEALIDVCLEHIPVDQPSRLVEIGFGSGCIAVTLAKQRPQCSVTATDVSDDALKFATANVQHHQVMDRVRLLSGSLFAPITADGGEAGFDGIVSNPPYIPDDELAGLQPEVSEHEPAVALAAGADGLDVVRPLIATAPSVLKPGGWIALEVDPSQCSAVAAMLDDCGFGRVRIHQDLNHADRIVEARRE
ncbi:MAG: peptide chain release factor N(5)-glutamine methyltransferase [Planctomycetaceae bacterium]